MRWPLRNQILLPMVGLMLASLVGVSVMNAYLSARRTRLRIEDELVEVIETLSQSNFPLTDGVLKQMRGLSGAEFVLSDPRGRVTASSTGRDVLDGLPAAESGRTGESSSLTRRVVVGGRGYFYSRVQLPRPADSPPSRMLHILYPEERYQQAWRDVVYPPLLVGAAAILLAAAFSLAIASQVTRPLSRLQDQVGGIARGNFRSVPVPRRDDEVADLSRSVNRMAELLDRYESEVRRNEQLRTLGQLGGGIAHQMRNSATGCRMAVELHARQCPLRDESLQVAKRQLELMENYLQRFLALGRPAAAPHQHIALQPILAGVRDLVAPTAQHLHVALRWDAPAESLWVWGDADGLEQLLVNLVLNAIEAACLERAERVAAVAPPAEAPEGQAQAALAPEVAVRLQPASGGVELRVENTGPPPPREVEGNLFDPFVTGKPDGIGLGLSVAREIALSHGGRIAWRRRDDRTEFVVFLPSSPPPVLE